MGTHDIRWYGLLFVVILALISIGGAVSAWEVEIDAPTASEQISGRYNVTGIVNMDGNDTGEVAFVNLSFDGGIEYVTNASNAEWTEWYYRWSTADIEDETITVMAALYVRRDVGGGNGTKWEYTKEDEFSVDVEVTNEKPTATLITTPGSTANFGQKLYFEGKGDAATGLFIREYEWRSNIDFVISNKTAFNISTLSPGAHAIKFKVKDNHGVWSDSKVVNIQVSVSVEDDWPFFHGNAMRTGVASSGPSVATEMWSYESDPKGNFTSPVVFGGKLFIGEIVDPDKGQAGKLYAFDLDGTHDGIHGNATDRADMLWNATFPTPVYGIPGCRNDKVFVGTQFHSTEDNFFALDTDSGEELWSYKAQGHVTTSPIVTGGMVIFGDSNFRVYALDPVTGDEIWKTNLHASIYSSPVVVGGNVYIAASNGNLYIIDAEDGNQTTSQDVGGSHETSPVFHDDRIFFTARGKGAVDTILARNKHDLKDSADGAWKYLPGARVHTTPVVTDDNVFIVTENGKVVAIDMNGSEDWTYKINDTVETSPILGGDLLFITGNSGFVYALNITTQAMEWTHDVGYTMTTPALSNDILIVSGNNTITALWSFTGPEANILNISVTEIPDITALNANYTWYQLVDRNPFNVSVDIEVKFTGSGTDPLGLDITEYEWISVLEGSEAQIGSAEIITHSFDIPGNYTIKLKVKNSNNIESTYAYDNIVVYDNAPPTVRFETSNQYIGEFVSFDLSTSDDGSEGSIILFVIDFGEGSDLTIVTDPSRPVFHKYSSDTAEEYLVTVSAYDDAGLLGKNIKNVKIDARPDVPQPPGEGGGGDDDDIMPLLFLIIVIVLVVVLIVAVFLMRKSLPFGKGKKKKVVEFKEDEVEEDQESVDEDERDRMLEEIAASLGTEKKEDKPDRPRRKVEKPIPKEPEPEAGGADDFMDDEEFTAPKEEANEPETSSDPDELSSLDDLMADLEKLKDD